ncbi:MAG: dinitrogenase iron-molybdenum cofactor biosynthesis protein [Desulfovibrionaceae bacterium]|nr:dinitrogenase iron-molybdenum cofactor biosynthesis protein [Desulfovibrionaceae bacterium]
MKIGPKPGPSGPWKTHMLICLACYEDRLASVFESAPELRLFKTGEQGPVLAGRMSLPPGEPVDRVSALVACGVQLLICGAVCGCTRRMLENSGLIIHPWVRGGVDEVLAAFERGALDKLSMPGCRNRPGQGRGRCARQGRGGGGLGQVRNAAAIETDNHIGE